MTACPPIPEYFISSFAFLLFFSAVLPAWCSFLPFFLSGVLLCRFPAWCPSPPFFLSGALLRRSSCLALWCGQVYTYHNGKSEYLQTLSRYPTPLIYKKG
jgi:hypothetical protein